MPTASATTICSSIITRLTTWAGYAYYNTRNCIVVPQFCYQPGWDTRCVQIHAPSVSRGGAGGGTFLENIRVMVGVFTRSAGDSVGEWKAAHAKNWDELLLITARLENYDCGILCAGLWQDSTVVQPSRFADESGEVVKGVLWSVVSFSGIVGNTTLDYIEAGAPG